MSKNYTMVQITWAPGSFPGTPGLREAVLGKVDTYIKAGKAPMAGAWSTVEDFERKNFPVDYRSSGSLNTRMLQDGSFDQSKEQTAYRIFVDAEAAQEFIAFVLDHGAVGSQVVTEDDIATGKLDAGVLFPSEQRVAELIWPGYPNFEYTGTYPTAGDPDATPVYA
jgi:hypothetical protein